MINHPNLNGERERERERQNTQNPPSDFPHKTRKFDEILNVTLNILYYIVLWVNQ